MKGVAAGTLHRVVLVAAVLCACAATAPVVSARSRCHRRSALCGRRALDGGVARQLSYFQIGDVVCKAGPFVPGPSLVIQPREERPGSPPRTGAYPGPFGALNVCFYGFASAAPIDVLVMGPGGFRKRQQVPPLTARTAPQERVLNWSVRRGAPTGDYTMTALQDGLSATATFVVHRSAIRTVADRVRRGRPIRLLFAGFPPRAQVAVDVYRNQYRCPHLHRTPQAEMFCYVHSFRTRVDARGRLAYRLDTYPGDPLHTYVFAARSGAEQPPPTDWVTLTG